MKTRKISRRDVLKLAGAASALGVVGVPLEAFAAESDDERRLFIGFDLHFTGPSSTAGIFVMSGQLEDSGTSTVSSISTVPVGRVSGDQQFVGQKGTIFTHFDGVAFPNNSPHQVGDGRFKILSGTSAYAGVRGGGSFLIVVDALSNQLIGTETGSVETPGEGRV